MENTQYEKMREVTQPNITAMRNMSGSSNIEDHIEKSSPLLILNKRLEDINCALQNRAADIHRISDRLFGDEPENPHTQAERESLPGQYGLLENCITELAISMGALDTAIKRLEEKA